MKFAVLALLGLANATTLEAELEELVGNRWSAADAKKIKREMESFGEWVEDHEDDFEKMGEQFEEDLGMDKLDEDDLEKYAKPAMKIAMSKEVALKKAYEEWMMTTPKGQRLQKAAMTTAADFMKGVMPRDLKNLKAYEGYDMIKKDGSYVEWVDNKWAREMFEDLYEIKEALKAIVEDKKMMKANEKLGMAVLSRPEFAQMWGMFMEDMNVKNEQELEEHFAKAFMKIQMRAANCPLRKEMEKRLMKLWFLSESTKKVEDLSAKDMQDYATWWKKNDFQPWI